MKYLHLSQWLASLFVFGILVGGVTCFDYCTTPCVSRQTYKHTMCLYPKEETGPLCRSFEPNKDLTEQDKQNIVKIHNELRSKVAEGKETRGSPGPQPPASNMMELVWDKELELIARRWALQCDYTHDRCRSTQDRVYSGQNLAISSDSTGFKNDIENQVTTWYDEVELTPNNAFKSFVSGSSESGADIGHYTQLVWAETDRIGCARVYFDYSDWGMTEYLVCNYGKGGNVKNQPMYKNGKQCSGCSNGLKCSSKYRGLCGNSLAGSPPATKSKTTPNNLPEGSSPKSSPKSSPPSENTDATSHKTNRASACAGVLQWEIIVAIISTILIAKSL